MKRLILATAAMLVIATGCGGDDSNGGDYTGGLASSKVVGDLSQDDFNKICDSTDKSSLDVLCRLKGFSAAASATSSTDADLRAACKVAYDACLKMPDTSSSDCKNDKPSSACKATVGETSACLKDTYASFDKAIPKCESLTQTSLGNLTEPTEPASCAVVKQKCPEFEEPDMP